MGSCLSKKSTSCSSSKSISTSAKNKEITKTNNTLLEKNKEGDLESVKKEIFVIKHEEKGVVINANESVESARNGNNGIVVSGPVRTSSCTKEEVDAILIQCGRLSRSSSDNNNGSCQKSRKYSGSKRSYDFENEGVVQESVVDGCEGDDEVGIGVRRHRQRQRQPRTPNSSSQGRRRTPSREREQGQMQGQRSGSRERGNSSGGRRVSRSPNRRSESPSTNVAPSGNGNGNNNGSSNRPGKMVSVPATVTSMVMDKSIDADNISAAAIKRIQVKRSADGSRTAASPRARSPARVNAKGLNEQQPMSLSRSNSRKQEQSPYRRNPLSEIDANVVVEHVPGTKAVNNNIHSQKLNAENVSNGKVVQQGSENKLGISKATPNGKVKEQQQLKAEEAKAMHTVAGNVAMNVIVSGPESLKPHGVTRSRSQRLSRDLDNNPETLTNPPQSYTALLLEDIQNFHQKGSNTTAPAFSLPPCVTKACSILDAVADLNSTTSSNLSSAFSGDMRRNHPTAEKFNQNDNTSFGVDPPGKKRLGIKDPFVESEVTVSDDLMEPSIQKYVTFRRGTVGVGDIEDQESSGSNSIAGSQQNWLSPSSWEPNSADSTDCWPSSRSYSRDDNKSPLGFQRHAVSETGHDMVEEGKRRVNVKKRDLDNQQTGIGRGRVGPRGGLNTTSMAATAAST